MSDHLLLVILSVLSSLAPLLAMEWATALEREMAVQFQQLAFSLVPLLD